MKSRQPDISRIDRVLTFYLYDVKKLNSAWAGELDNTFCISLCILKSF
jgi:hypothetical protein